MVIRLAPNIYGTMPREMTAKYMTVSLPTLDALLQREENPLPCIKVGRKYLIPTALLDEWLKAEAERTGVIAPTIKKSKGREAKS